MLFPEERTSARGLFPFPEEGETVEENPPCLTWVPPEGRHTYTVTLWDGEHRQLSSLTTDRCYAVPELLPGAGRYFFDVEGEDGSCRGKRSFFLSPGAVTVPRRSVQDVLDGIPAERPRHLFCRADLPALRQRTVELAVLRRNIAQAIADGCPEAPRFDTDPDALPYREYFGRFRDFADRDLVALALGYVLLDNRTAGDAGKALLLTLCAWDPWGVCSVMGAHGDEIGLSMARVLPSVYDLLFPLLSAEERQLVTRRIHDYGTQCYRRLLTVDYAQNPGDSHAGRLPAYLGEAALALWGSGVQKEEEGRAWLAYALDVYGGIFPYYGTPDGGWAEGTFYATSYTKWYLPFFSAVERYGGTRFLDRPFYQRLTRFFLHFADPAQENHPFGDGYWCHPEDEEWRGFFAQNPCRFYARRSGEAQAQARAAAQTDVPLYELHLLDVFLPAGTPPATSLTLPVTPLAVFPGAGFVSYHRDLSHPKKDLCLLVRASRFGSDSHRHADQGSFALYARGVALISPSGYFGRRYGSLHHREWTKQTRAHNALLINGEGQPVNSMDSRGKILSAQEINGILQIKVDISEAYAALKTWIRTFTLTGNVLTVTDVVEAEKPVTVGYPLHMLSRPEVAGEDLCLARRGVSLRVSPITGGLHLRQVTDRFAVELNAGEPARHAVQKPAQYHVLYETVPARSHHITVTYTVGDDPGDSPSKI